MSSSRRFWLLSPLVVLTLFFGACGWRNWHLSGSETQVWLAVPAYDLSVPAPIKMPKGAVVGIGSEPAPFGVGQTTVLRRWSEAQSKWEPVPASLLYQLQRRYPQFRLRNWSNSAPDSYRDNQRYFSIEGIRFQSEFAATCRVIFSTRAPHMAQFGTNRGTLTLTRSPLPFRDTQWRVREWRWESYDMN